MKRKKKTPGPTVDIHVRLAADLAAWIKAEAARDARSVANLVGRLIRDERERRGGVK